MIEWASGAKRAVIGYKQECDWCPICEQNTVNVRTFTLYNGCNLSGKLSGNMRITFLNWYRSKTIRTHTFITWCWLRVVVGVRENSRRPCDVGLEILVNLLLLTRQSCPTATSERRTPWRRWPNSRRPAPATMWRIACCVCSCSRYSWICFTLLLGKSQNQTTSRLLSWKTRCDVPTWSRVERLWIVSVMCDLTTVAILNFQKLDSPFFR